MSKVQKELGLNLFLSFYLFFTGWLQFHHCHDAVDYLNLGDPPSQVVVLGIGSARITKPQRGGPRDKATVRAVPLGLHLGSAIFPRT